MKTKATKSTKSKPAKTTEVGNAKAEKSKDKLAKKIAKMGKKASKFLEKSEKWKNRAADIIAKLENKPTPKSKAPKRLGKRKMINMLAESMFKLNKRVSALEEHAAQ